LNLFRCAGIHRWREGVRVEGSTAHSVAESEQDEGHKAKEQTAMGITRKRFLRSMTGGTVVLLFQACGGGGSYGGSGTGYGGNPMPASGCGSSGTQISGNHGHSLTIASTDLDSMTDKVYSIMGAATHDHMVTLTVAQLAKLKAGQSVTVTSSVTNAPSIGSHSHDVTVSCM
jgi:hypothetical protein